MPIDQLIISLLIQYEVLIIKYLGLIFLIFHVALSLIIVKQTQEMIRVVEARISPVIYLVSLIHLFFSVGLIIWTLLFL